MASGSFSSLFIALCSSSDVAVYLNSEFLGFASCLHSLGIHLPRLETAFKKSSTNVTGRVIVQTFPTNITESFFYFYFHLNRLRNFPAKTYRSVKKRIALAQRRGGQCAFLRTSQQPISVRHELKTSLVI